MRKIASISIGLLLLTVTVLGFAAAETVTTYYMYENGEWRLCNGEEAIVAEEAMTKETPVTLTREGFSSLLSSQDPFWNYDVLKSAEEDADITVPTPTTPSAPAISVSSTKTPVSNKLWDSINTRLSTRTAASPSRWLSHAR